MADNLVEKHFPGGMWLSEMHTAEMMKHYQAWSFGEVHVLVRRLAETHDDLQEAYEALWAIYDRCMESGDNYTAKLAEKALGCLPARGE